jgi:hypothetical protein
MENVLKCEDFAALNLPCCNSCHEESDMGIDALLEIEIDWEGNHVHAHVCCKIANHFEGL